MIRLDFETRSQIDIREVGAHVYSAHPTTEIVCAAWAIGDEKPSLWFPEKFGVDCDAIDDLYAELIDREFHFDRTPTSQIDHDCPEFISAYNAEFERLIWENILMRHHGAPSIHRNRWYCTAINAYACTYGRRMEQAAIQIGALEKKDKAGSDLMLRMCKPRKPTKHEDPSKIYWHETVEELRRLGQYCRQDVRTEMSIQSRLPLLKPFETEMYHVDQEINSRGFEVDLELARAAVEIEAAESSLAPGRLSELTMGVVTAPTQVARIREFAQAWGYPFKSLGQEKISEFYRTKEGENCSPELRELLDLRKKFGRSSTDKFKAAMRRSINSRVCGTLLMFGARTHRWTGSGVQPQNFKRGLQDPIKQGQLIELVKAHDTDTIEALYGDTYGRLGDVARGMIVAKEGHELMVSDFSSIEAVAMAIVANDAPNLTAFATGHCPYKEMASDIFSIPYDSIPKDSHERYVGKQAELAFQYGMGESVFQAQQRAKGKDFSKAFCKEVKLKYRRRHKAIVKFWALIERKALRCVLTGEPQQHKWFRFEMRSNPRALVMISPKGSEQYYVDPIVKNIDKFNSGNPEPVLTYMNQENNQWVRIDTWGGKEAENLIQFICADIQMDSVIAVNKIWPVVFHTHDEIITEIKEGTGNVPAMEKTMSNASAYWATGWPIKAKGGWIGKRYRK